MARALSVSEVLNQNKPVIPFDGEWYEAFGQPERRGVWFIWGNSGNGKTSFVMQLCKELAKYGTVGYNSLEEGAGLTMQNTFRRFKMAEAGKRFKLIPGENMEELGERLLKKKSLEFVVIDSYQYTQMTYKDYILFKEKYAKNKLLIFISHADGKQPSGRSAKSVRYDAALKVWVEGYRAFSQGRFIGPVGSYTIWEDGAIKYWGVQ